MASNISHKKLDSLEQQLAELAEAGPQSFSLKAAVEKLMPTIEAAREKQVRWPQIAKIINKALGNQQTSERTIRQYYYELRSAQQGSPDLRITQNQGVAAKQPSEEQEDIDSAVVVPPSRQAETDYSSAEPRPERKSRFTKSVRPKRH